MLFIICDGIYKQTSKQSDTPMHTYIHICMHMHTFINIYVHVGAHMHIVTAVVFRFSTKLVQIAKLAMIP